MILLRFQWQIEMDTRRLLKKTNGINEIAEESKIKTSNCLLFLEVLSLEKIRQKIRSMMPYMKSRMFNASCWY